MVVDVTVEIGVQLVPHRREGIHRRELLHDPVGLLAEDVEVVERTMPGHDDDHLETALGELAEDRPYRGAKNVEVDHDPVRKREDAGRQPERGQHDSPGDYHCAMTDGIGRKHVDTERKVRAVILQTADREEGNRLVLQDGSHPLGTDELVGVRVVRRICDRNSCLVAPH